eukprot:TRINITY_DN4951_c0_g1_i2.p2 TRINITY_DN4951_c0_g1~~TRINITY_DN4951_c0_g1_i2.p2  ORF type:complete len:643 (+),score=150.06 TRINITY_DN4951_c0_g1_i2:179-1930(+)
MTSAQIEEARRFAEMEAKPPTPPPEVEEAGLEAHEEHYDEPEEAVLPTEIDEAGSIVHASVRLTMDTTQKTQRTSHGTPTTRQTNTGTGSIRQSGTGEGSVRQSSNVRDTLRTACSHGTSSPADQTLRRAVSSSHGERPLSQTAPPSVEDEEAHGEYNISAQQAAKVRSSLKTGETIGQLKTVVLEDLQYPLQPASRTTTAASECSLSLTDNAKLVHTVGASTAEGEVPLEMPLQEQDQSERYHEAPERVREEGTPSLRNHAAPYTGGAESATLSSAHTTRGMHEPEFVMPERLPPERFQDHLRLFDQHAQPVRDALATGNPDDVVEEVHDERWPFPVPPSPTPKLNPIVLREEKERAKEEEEEPPVETQTMEEWEVKVQHALSRIRSLDVGLKEPVVKRSGVLANCFTPGSAYTGRSDVPMSQQHSNMTPIRTPVNEGKSFLVPERNRGVSPTRGGPSMKSHVKTNETVVTTAMLLDTVAGGAGGLSEPPPPHTGIDFGETLLKIEACTKADFDAVSSKLETLKGKMEATHQSWTATSPIKLAADRWRGADLPGGLWGPTYRAAAEDYHRVLEPHGRTFEPP